MIIFCNNKDMDGYASGAICKLKYPDAKLIGWDYKDSIPDFQQFVGEEVIMIDITFPLEKLIALSHIANSLTVIDHHVSFKKEYDTFILGKNQFKDFTYIYDVSKAACEIGWKYLFPDKEIPTAILWLGMYDTWRNKDEKYNWDLVILPFQYYARVYCTSPETFDNDWFDDNLFQNEFTIDSSIGDGILRYQSEQDRLACERSSFEREVYGGLRGICLNTRAFSSNTLKTVYNPEKHDIMIGFEYTGTKWSISLRSVGDKADCSIIAKQRGGGGA